jgi:hypothetical protein
MPMYCRNTSLSQHVSIACDLCKVCAAFVQMRLHTESADASADTSGPLNGSPADDAVLLSAYRSRSETPGNSAPLLPRDSGQIITSGSGFDNVAMLGGMSSSAAVPRSSVTVHGNELYSVDRKTKERAAAYAFDDGLGSLRKHSSRGGGSGS